MIGFEIGITSKRETASVRGVSVMSATVLMTALVPARAAGDDLHLASGGAARLQRARTAFHRIASHRAQGIRIHARTASAGGARAVE